MLSEEKTVELTLGHRRRCDQGLGLSPVHSISFGASAHLPLLSVGVAQTGSRLFHPPSLPPPQKQSCMTY